MVEIRAWSSMTDAIDEAINGSIGKVALGLLMLILVGIEGWQLQESIVHTQEIAESVQEVKDLRADIGNHENVVNNQLVRIIAIEDEQEKELSRHDKEIGVIQQLLQDRGK